MKAKRLMLAALTLGLGFAVAGCGELPGESTGGAVSSVDPSTANYVVPESFDTSKNITITFYHTMGKGKIEILDAMISKFETDYPNVNVEYTVYSDYNAIRDAITTEIPNDNQPNFAYCYADHVALYNKAKAVVQLDSLIHDETFGYTTEQIADFVPGYYAEGKSFGDGYTYTMPFSKSTELLYYNKTYFEKHNLTVPTTWAEMAAVCAQIKQIEGNATDVFPLGIDSESNLFITLAEQTGSKYTSATGNHYLFDNTQNRTMVSQFKQWFDAGYFTTSTLLNGYTSTLFTTGKSFMSIGSSAGSTYQYPDDNSFEVGIAAIPKYDADRELKCISQGPNLCIFNKKNDQEVLATWIFISKYLLSVEFQSAFSQASGYMPVIQSVYDEPTFAAFMESASGKAEATIPALAAKVGAELAPYYYTSPAFVGSSTARDQVGDLFVAVLNGTSLDEAFENALLECED